MQQTFDVAVIGAGMLGSASAKYLAFAGAKVALIGPAEPASPSAAKNVQSEFAAYYDDSRIVRRMGWDDIWGTLDTASLLRYRQIEEQSAVEFFVECGSLVLIAKSITTRTAKMIGECSAKGIPVERLSETDLKRKFPFFSSPPVPGGFEGLYEETAAGWINPRRLVAAQLAIFEKTGGTLIRAAAEQPRYYSSAREWRIPCGEKEIVAKKVLLATGALSNHSGLLPEGVFLSMTAFTEPNLSFRVPDSELHSMQNCPATIIVDPEDNGNLNFSAYILPPQLMSDGTWAVRIGPGKQPAVAPLQSEEEIRDWYVGQRITPSQRSLLLRIQEAVLPSLDATMVKESCCIIEKTSSKFPYMGNVGDADHFHVLIGGNGHGTRGSDELGRIASTLLLENVWDSPLPRELFQTILISEAERRAAPISLRPPFGFC